MKPFFAIQRGDDINGLCLRLTIGHDTGGLVLFGIYIGRHQQYVVLLNICIGTQIPGSDE